ncbi:hypothetical protein QL818_15490 [Bacillus altitudinis]|uniref:hypothetical protein n=4 Tax=Bacillus altitudinis TaxID=293387 RepID=UPI00247FA361|nr:hypothetical protein [Bacillus altitudinis]MDI6648466.1 hypothetical protein [Bacillus altitudinis]MDI6663090.1 hypothetical protein [Bacillus altitudinis]
MQLAIFNEDPLYSEALEYWYEKWNSLSNEVKNGEIGIDVINIRMVLLDIRNEYELNKFESENNRKVYLNLIEKFLKEQHMHLYKDELLILKNYLEKKNGQAAYILSKELSEIFSNESFAQILFDELLILLKKKSFSKEHRIKISNLTKDIIIDLVTSGMDIDDVKKLCDEIFRSYILQNDEEIIILFKYIPEELPDIQAKEYIDNLSLEDRLNIFKKNLVLEEVDYTFIFPVWGMLVDGNETLFGLSIYDPLQTQKLDKEEWSYELFPLPLKSSDEVGDNKSRCNVIINVKATSINIAKKQAEEKYFIFLNLINLKFASKYTEVFWDGQYIGKKTDTQHSTFGITSSSNRDEKTLRRKLSKDHPIFLNNEKYKEMNDYSNLIDILQKRNMFIEVNSIINVIELMSKSIWESEENKLLNYWICLESLANISKKNNETKFTFIKETVSNMYFLWERFRPIHNLFLLTRHYTQDAHRNDETINIPTEFIKDVGIYESYNEDSRVSLINFDKRKHELLSYTTKVSFLDEIENTINFYNDNKEAIQRLKIKRDEVKLTIDYIYKTRNQIVHNGYISKKLIPYLVKFAEAYANSLLQRVIDVYIDNEFNLQNYFIKEQYEGLRLEKKLSNKEFYKLGLEK